MSEIPYIDLRNVDCWIVNLIPFASEERDDDNKISDYQQTCIKEKVFGIGWKLQNSSAQPGENLNSHIKKYFSNDIEVYAEENAEKNVKKYANEYAENYAKENKSEKDSSLVNSIEKCTRIKKGDYVIMRLKDSHYYIGKTNDAVKYAGDENSPNNSEALKKLSWYCTVDEWKEFQGEKSLPSDIIGRFSQRHQKTIDVIADIRVKLLVISAFEKDCCAENRLFNIPKLKLNKETFCRSLNYMELEDVVFYYIYNQHKNENYICFPSSCKINRKKVEYSFVSTDPGFDPITCQVKNQQKINVEDYRNEETYRIIYLFCGLWSDKKVEELNATYQNTNIKVISPSELFLFFKSNIELFGISEYYKLEEREDISGLLKSFEYEKRTRFNRKEKGKIQIKDGDDRISFSDDKLYYLKDFDALINEGADDDEVLKSVRKALNCT